MIEIQRFFSERISAPVTAARTMRSPDFSKRFLGEMIAPEEAIERTKTSAKPVGLLDMGDNVGGGATSDSTVLARLNEDRGQFKAFVCLADVESVQEAQTAGL